MYVSDSHTGSKPTRIQSEMQQQSPATELNNEELDTETSFSTMSDTTDESLGLYGLAAAPRRRRRRFPRPLKFPRSFQPRLLTAQQEQILVQRLTRLPERKLEGYQEKMTKKKPKPRAVSQSTVDSMVERLSKTSKDQDIKEEPGDVHVDVFWSQEEDTEWKLSKSELDRLTERLSRLKTRPQSLEPPAQEGRRILTSNEARKLTERLNQPRVYTDADRLPKLGAKESRFVGNKPLKSADMESLVERISFKGMKVASEDELWGRAERRKWSSWTGQDADYNQWRKTNRQPVV